MIDPRGAAGWLAAPFWNRHERRLRALWRIAGFAAFAAALSRLARAAGLPRGGPEHPLGVVTGLAVCMAALWLTTRFLERRPLGDVGLRWDRDFSRELGIGMLLGAFLMTGVFAAERAFGWITLTAAFVSEVPGQAFALAFLKPLLVFVCVGILEEVLFRGFLLRTLAQGFAGRLLPPRAALVVACVLSSVLFGLGHRNNPGATAVSTLNVAVAGVLLALPYLITARLALSIGLHITWNLCQGNLYGFPVSGITGLKTTVLSIRQGGPELWTGGPFGPEAGLLGLAAMGAGSVAIFLWLRGPRGAAEIAESLALPPARPVPTTLPSPPEAAEQLGA
jgi:CAAX protease family protein